MVYVDITINLGESGGSNFFIGLPLEYPKGHFLPGQNTLKHNQQPGAQ